MKNLIILGAGGHAEVCKEIAESMEKWNEIYFLDAKYPNKIKTQTDTKILGKITDAIKYKQDYDFFVGIGSNKVRENFLDFLIQEGYSIATLIDKSAKLQKNISIEKGTVIMPNTCINTCSKIGRGCIINTSVVVEHECIVDDYVHLSPGVLLAGNVHIGKNTWLGIGATVVNNIEIESEVIIGASSLVLKDMKFPGKYVGVPAKKLGVSE